MISLLPMASVKADVENRLEKRDILFWKKFQDPARIWTWDLLISSLVVRHSYHWATGPRWQGSVGRWHFHRTSFKFRLCISLLKGWWDWAVLAAEQRDAQLWPKPSKQSLSVMAWLVALVNNDKLITNGLGKGRCGNLNEVLWKCHLPTLRCHLGPVAQW